MKGQQQQEEELFFGSSPPRRTKSRPVALPVGPTYVLLYLLCNVSQGLLIGVGYFGGQDGV